jgi:hypothetical protein
MLRIAAFADAGDPALRMHTEIALAMTRRQIAQLQGSVRTS